MRLLELRHDGDRAAPLTKQGWALEPSENIWLELHGRLGKSSKNNFIATDSHLISNGTVVLTCKMSDLRSGCYQPRS